MKTLGVSITQNRLSALLLERTLFASRRLFSCDVSCREPFGGPDDVGNLAEEIRKGTGGKDLPTVVLALPASWTYLRQV